MTTRLADRYGRKHLHLTVSRRHDADDTVDVQLVQGVFTRGPINLRRRTLLAALDAEPDDTDYREVLADNTNLSLKLAKALKERDDAQEALRAAEEASEEPRTDQDQIDRSWALERAGEVLQALAATGATGDAAPQPLLELAEWIVSGGGDRG